MSALRQKACLVKVSSGCQLSFLFFFLPKCVWAYHFIFLCSWDLYVYVLFLDFLITFSVYCAGDWAQSHETSIVRTAELHPRPLSSALGSMLCMFASPPVTTIIPFILPLAVCVKYFKANLRSHAVSALCKSVGVCKNGTFSSFYSFFSWTGFPHSLWWPWIYFVAESDLELLILFPLPPKCGNDRRVSPSLILGCWGWNPGFSSCSGSNPPAVLRSIGP